MCRVPPALPGPAVPREAHRASPATCFPPGETSSEGDPSRGSLSLRFLVFAPWKFFPATLVLPGVHGREHSSSDSDRMAVPFGIHHICWSHWISAGTQLVLGQAAPLAFGILYLWSCW